LLRLIKNRAKHLPTCLGHAAPAEKPLIRGFEVAVRNQITKKWLSFRQVLPKDWAKGA
jgi:hypothetical protein